MKKTLLFLGLFIFAGLNHSAPARISMDRSPAGRFIADASFDGMGKDSQTLNKLKSHVDSLLANSLKLVKTLENDSALRNSETLQQVQHTLNTIKARANRYQQDLKDAVRKNTDTTVAGK